MKYLLPPVFGLVSMLIAAVMLLSGEPLNVGGFLLLAFLGPMSLLAAWGWWMVDRHRVDPRGTSRRLQGTGWAITISWLLANLFG